MSDLDASADWAAKNGGDPAKLAVSGFCWGGRIVWLYAAHGGQLKAEMAWSAGRRRNELKPKNRSTAKDMKAPVLGLMAAPTRAFQTKASIACARR